MCIDRFNYPHAFSSCYRTSRSVVTSSESLQAPRRPCKREITGSGKDGSQWAQGAAPAQPQLILVIHGCGLKLSDLKEWEIEFFKM